jgi:hypothetical protein
MGTKVRAMPRSGCSRTSNAGAATTAVIRHTAAKLRRLCRYSSARAATPRMVTTRANSEGWTV